MILSPFLDAGGVTLYAGDCIDVMRQLPEASVDAIITDPPYGLEFMGRDWDGFGTPLGFQTWTESWAREAYRILKPGGHLLAFGGTRTYHRLAAGIEDAGFEIRDCLAWLYGSGFPKSLDVSKAIDKQRDDRAEVYEVTGWIRDARDAAGVSNSDIDAAFGFHGMAGHWTSSKSQPAVPTLDQVPQLLDVLGVSPDDVPERIRRLLLDLNGRKGQPGEAWFQRKVVEQRKTGIGTGSGSTPIVGDGNRDITAPATPAAKKWQGWGTALKPAFEPIVLARKPLIGTVAQNVLEHGTGALNIDGCRIGATDAAYAANFSGTRGHDQNRDRASDYKLTAGTTPAAGRWPANVTLDETAAAMLDEQSGIQKDGTTYLDNRAVDYNASSYKIVDNRTGTRGYGGGGGASRFFYCAKASKKDRNTNGATNTHPTVKPTALMRWLIRLATPPGGIILDPFGGSGSTGVAARAEGVSCILIEREAEYLDIIRQRLDDGSLFGELA